MGGSLIAEVIVMLNLDGMEYLDLLDKEEELKEEIGKLFSSGADLTTKGNMKIDALNEKLVAVQDRIDEIRAEQARKNKRGGDDMNDIAKSAIRESIAELDYEVHEIYLANEQEAKQDKLDELEEAIEDLKSLI